MDFKKYKIAIISPVPFYYHIPFYKELSCNPQIDLEVIYCSKETIKGEDVKKMYKSSGHIIDKNKLTEGYKSKFLKNYSLNPSFMNWPFGLVNFGIWREIFSKKYDAVVLQSWTNFTWWLAFLACIFSGTPVMFMTDSNISAEGSKSAFLKFFRKVVLKGFLFKFASGFLTSGTANEEFYRYYGVPDKKMVRSSFSWGYEELFSKGEEILNNREKLRKFYKISDNEFVILYVGRLSPEKDLGTLLEAYSKVKNENKKMFFVGNGPMLNMIKKKIKELDVKNVELVGFQNRDSILNYYAISDLLVLPSISETWGMVVNEAMCFGLPVISSDKVGAAVDLIKNGYNGFIFRSRDSEELAVCIRKIIELPKESYQDYRKNSRIIISNWIKNLEASKQILKIIKTFK